MMRHSWTTLCTWVSGPLFGVCFGIVRWSWCVPGFRQARNTSRAHERVSRWPKFAAKCSDVVPPTPAWHQGKLVRAATSDCNGIIYGLTGAPVSNSAQTQTCPRWRLFWPVRGLLGHHREPTNTMVWVVAGMARLTASRASEFALAGPLGGSHKDPGSTTSNCEAQGWCYQLGPTPHRCCYTADTKGVLPLVIHSVIAPHAAEPR